MNHTDRLAPLVAGVVIAAAGYFDEHPEYASDERLAGVFRDYAARMRAVPVPGRVGATS